MKALFKILLILPLGFLSAQKIGAPAPEKPPVVFPLNTWGADIMFGEGGFGFGTFYRRNFSQTMTGFFDFSISGLKDDREMDYYDPYTGTTYSPNKLNRALLMPVNVGIQYRLFSDVLTENFRPYVSAAVGPHAIVTTPYEEEFFNSFKYAKMHYGIGGYIGLGANIGESRSNLLGLSIRYYYTSILGDGIETMIGSVHNNYGQIFISLNLGVMY
jgi:hypothetical protein